MQLLRRLVCYLAGHDWFYCYYNRDGELVVRKNPIPPQNTWVRGLSFRGQFCQRCGDTIGGVP